MKTISLPFGKKSVRIKLPDKLNYTVLKSRPIKPIKDISTALNRALDKPIGTRPFNKLFNRNDRVTLVVPDKTRRCGADKILQVIVSRLLKLGILYRHMTVILARGIHPAHSNTEIRRLVGEMIYRNIKVFDHDARNPKDLVNIGITSHGTQVEVNRYAVEADKVVTLGVVQYHYFAGFCGGRKSILPGIAGYQTINQNHSLVLRRPPLTGKNPAATLGKLEGNPVNEDMIEGAGLLGVDFSINLVVDHNESVLKVFAGDIIKSHRRGCDFLDSFFRVYLKEPVDCIIASGGGYPTDINYIQAHKTLEHCSKALKENGKMIVLAECAEGIGSDVFREWLKYDNMSDMITVLRKEFLVPGHTALCSLIKAQRFDIYLYSKLAPAIVRRMQFTPIPLKSSRVIQAVVDKVVGALRPGARVLIFPEGYSLLPVVKE